MNESRALELLRTADPAADSDVAWTGAPLVTESLRHTPRVWLAAAAAALLVAGVGYTVAGTRDDHQSHPPAASASGLIEPGAPDPHRAATIALVRRAIRDVPVPEGAARAQAGRIGLDPQLIDESARWIVPGRTTDEVLAYVRTHLPARDGWQETGGGSGSDGTRLLYYEGPESPWTQYLQLSVTVIPHGTGAGLLVEVRAYWVPSRTTDSIIGAITSIDATITVTHLYETPRTTTTQRTLAGPAATRIARASDGASGAVVIARLCPMIVRSVTIDLVVHTASAVFEIKAFNDSCMPGATITAADGRNYRIASGAIIGAVYAALGLPKDYGSR